VQYGAPVGGFAHHLHVGQGPQQARQTGTRRSSSSTISNHSSGIQGQLHRGHHAGSVLASSSVKQARSPWGLQAFSQVGQGHTGGV
jgi:hypothetical protein